VRVHYLKHTFGRRLRTAGVPLETRNVLLAHKTGDMTSHYSAPELAELIRGANAVLKAQESVVASGHKAGAGGQRGKSRTPRSGNLATGHNSHSTGNSEKNPTRARCQALEPGSVS
jgi:hypothetical protein